MITLETLEHLPNAKKTVGKFIVGIEKQDGTNKRRLFYIGANVDRNQSKTQLLQEAGFEKEDRKEVTFLSSYTADDIAEILGNEMEDRNHHYLTGMFQELLKTLEFYVPKLSDKQKCLILCETYNNLFCERDSN